MKVRVISIRGAVLTFDAEFDVIICQLSDEHRKNIANMAPEGMLYAAYPEGMNEKRVREMMDKAHEDLVTAQAPLENPGDPEDPEDLGDPEE